MIQNCSWKNLPTKYNMSNRIYIINLIYCFPRHACFYLPMFHNFLMHLPDQQVSDCKIMKTIYYETCNFRLEMAGGWMQVIMPAHPEYKMLEHRQMGLSKTA